MKKLLLSVLMVVIVATPCLAEVEPESLFSIDNTLWLIFPSETESYFGFSGGKVYTVTPDGGTVAHYSSYTDRPWGFSTFWTSDETVGMLFPIILLGWFCTLEEMQIDIGECAFLLKTSDNWTPDE